MGTVNLLECIRLTSSVRSFVNITTDKVYENKEWEYGYRECDPLDGYDPVSYTHLCSLCHGSDSWNLKYVCDGKKRYSNAFVSACSDRRTSFYGPVKRQKRAGRASVHDSRRLPHQFYIKTHFPGVFDEMCIRDRNTSM